MICVWVCLWCVSVQVYTVYSYIYCIWYTKINIYVDVNTHTHTYIYIYANIYIYLYVYIFRRLNPSMDMFFFVFKNKFDMFWKLPIIQNLSYLSQFFTDFKVIDCFEKIITQGNFYYSSFSTIDLLLQTWNLSFCEKMGFFFQKYFFELKK